MSVGGHVAPGFEAVRETFAETLGDHGAAFAVTMAGGPVVDLWGGVADERSGRPWQAGTLQVIFSGTKGLVALCLLMLADRRQLDLQAPVARYWPEFGASGKRGIRVVDVASHQARLPALRAPVAEDEILDDRRMAGLLAAQPVESDPRAAFTYHPLTYGWLCGELIRRVDGRSVGRFFAEEVAAPLRLEVWIGLPADLEPRVSRLAQAADWGRRQKPGAEGDELLDRVRNNPPLFSAGRIPWNSPAWHGAEIPGAGGIGTARSLARLYGCLAVGGELDGVRLLGAETLARGREVLRREWDPLAEHEQAFGVGFELQTAAAPLGPAPDAFGHRGAGGSVHCAWPSLGAGVSYAMNLMRDDHEADPRARALLEAVHAALVRHRAGVMMRARWTRRHLARLVANRRTTAPAVDGAAPPSLLPGTDLWDPWPVQEEDGTPSVVQDRELWMALSAPAVGHPEDRHDVARLRLLATDGAAWSDLGPVFADGTSPGSREWSGCAVRRLDGTVSVYYTAAGHRGEVAPTYVQRVMEARCAMVDGGRLEHSVEHHELVRPDGRTYLPADETDGMPGSIRAFRDPSWFRDPTDGRGYLLIAASVPWRGRSMGAIAVAADEGGTWALQPPLLRAQGISHEIERPHIVVHGARYYLFFSAQRHSFHPPLAAPTGLYGFVAADLSGPWEPLNGSGLVIRNPPDAPDQAYAWLVLSDLRAVSFLNYRSPAGGDLRGAPAEEARAGFGGTLAPTLQLALAGSVTSIVESSNREETPR